MSGDAAVSLNKATLPPKYKCRQHAPGAPLPRGDLPLPGRYGVYEAPSNHEMER
jgi:hypothetical protein